MFNICAYCVFTLYDIPSKHSLTGVTGFIVPFRLRVRRPQTSIISAKPVQHVEFNGLYCDSKEIWVSTIAQLSFNSEVLLSNRKVTFSVPLLTIVYRMTYLYDNP